MPRSPFVPAPTSGTVTVIHVKSMMLPYCGALKFYSFESILGEEARRFQTHRAENLAEGIPLDSLGGEEESTGQG